MYCTMYQFSEINRRRCESPDGFNHTVESWSLSDWMTALTGEIGEAANVIKKLNRSRDGIPGNTKSDAELREDLKDELADAFIYLDLMAQAAGFRLADAVGTKFLKTSEKIGYPTAENRQTMLGQFGACTDHMNASQNG